MKLRDLQAGNLYIEDWEIRPGENWCILGGNASGKSLLAAVVAGEAKPDSGSISNRPERVVSLSFESMQADYEAELANDDTDFLDRIDYGSTGREILSEASPETAEINALARRFSVEHLLDRGCRQFSTGELRRIYLLRAVLQNPDLLALDEPFEGLDALGREKVADLIGELIATGHSLLLLVNRLDDISPCCSHLAILHTGRILASGPREEILASTTIRHLIDLDQRPIPDLPLPLHERASVATPIFEIRDCSVVYSGVYQFKSLDWRLNPGEHTVITGPNGCGKSTLLALLTGDHPQCYTNNITIFGYRRGTGESIWEIKRHLGLVSPALHRDYRVAAAVESVVVSGFYDSIGLYHQPSSQELRAAREWLAVFGMEPCARLPFKSLSYGQQRLALIARALVKQPPLLILDEPTQGLDDLNRQLVLACLQRLAALRDTTLLFVSHRADEHINLFQRRLEFHPSSLPTIRYEIQQQPPPPTRPSAT